MESQKTRPQCNICSLHHKKIKALPISIYLLSRGTWADPRNALESTQGGMSQFWGTFFGPEITFARVVLREFRKLLINEWFIHLFHPSSIISVLTMCQELLWVLDTLMSEFCISLQILGGHSGELPAGRWGSYKTPWFCKDSGSRFEPGLQGDLEVHHSNDCQWSLKKKKKKQFSKIFIFILEGFSIFSWEFKFFYCFYEWNFLFIYIL